MFTEPIEPLKCWLAFQICISSVLIGNILPAQEQITDGEKTDGIKTRPTECHFQRKKYINYRNEAKRSLTENNCPCFVIALIKSR